MSSEVPAHASPGPSSASLISHPLRLEILSLLTGASLSAAEVGRELGVPQANASYHLRVLARFGMLVEDGTEKIRGGTAKRYRYQSNPDLEDVRTSTREEAHEAVAVLADLLVHRHANSTARPDQLLSDTHVWLTPEAWRSVRQHLLAASAIAHAQAQPSRTPGTARYSITSVAFRMRR